MPQVDDTCGIAIYLSKTTEHLKLIEKLKFMLYHQFARRGFMKCKIFINKEHEEEVVIYAHEKTKLVQTIEQLVSDEIFELIGFAENEIVKLTPTEVFCFVVEKNKIYALTEKEKLQIKCRLYQLEERLSENFIKINQSCIANIRKIEKFDVSFSGSLVVKFKNGYIDFVSRRNLKNVKERLGF